MILWQLFTRQPPFKNLTKYEVMYKKICTENPHETIPLECPKVLRDIIQDCWNEIPEKRPTAKKIGERCDAALKELTAISEASIQISKIKRTISAMSFFYRKNEFKAETQPNKTRIISYPSGSKSI